MKKFVIAMVIIILVGCVSTGVGCAVYFTGDNRFFKEDLVYTENTFVSEQEFDTVYFDIKNAHNIIFKRGDCYSVRYSESQFSDVNVTVENGTLKVSENGEIWKHWWDRLRYRRCATELEITVPENVALSLNGLVAGYVKVELPAWQFGNINLNCKGAADFTGNGVQIAKIDVSVAGAADFDLNGVFGDIKLTASGAADLALSGTAKSIIAYAAGSIEMSANNFNCPLIQVDASGSMDITLSGTGDILRANASGSGDIVARNFTLKTCSLDVSGSLDAEVSVSDRLDIKASGSADVDYWGDPTVERHVSGSSHITKRG